MEWSEYQLAVPILLVASSMTRMSMIGLAARFGTEGVAFLGVVLGLIICGVKMLVERFARASWPLKSSVQPFNDLLEL